MLQMGMHCDACCSGKVLDGLLSRKNRSRLVCVCVCVCTCACIRMCGGFEVTLGLERGLGLRLECDGSLDGCWYMVAGCC